MAGKGIKNNEPTAGVTSSSKDENKEITENIGLSTEENQPIAETKASGKESKKKRKRVLLLKRRRLLHQKIRLQTKKMKRLRVQKRAFSYFA